MLHVNAKACNLGRLTFFEEKRVTISSTQSVGLTENYLSSQSMKLGKIYAISSAKLESKNNNF